MISFTKKTIFVFAVMIVFIGMMGSYGIYKIQQLHSNASQLYSHSYIVSNAAKDIKTDIILIHHNMLIVASSGTHEARKKAIAQVSLYEQDVQKQFDIISKRFLGDTLSLKKARQIFVGWQPIREQVIHLAQAGKTAQALAMNKAKGAAQGALANRMMESFSAYAKGKADTFYARAQKGGEDSVLAISLLMIMILIAVIGVAFMIIRQQKRSEIDAQHNIQRLKRSENKHRELLDASPDAVIIVNHRRIIQIVNIQAVKMFGYSAEELTGSSIEMLVPEKYIASHSEQADIYIKQPKSRPIGQGRRLLALKKDGVEIPVSISLSPIIIDGEQFVTSDIRDMSEQESIEEQLRQAQKMEAIGTLVGGIAHDFNNVLAVIAGSVFMAKRRLNAQDDKYLNSIETQSERAAEMVQYLLAFARKGVIQKKTVSLTGLLASSNKVLRMSTTEHIQLNIDLCDKDLFVDGDQAQLQQILMNLVNNARDALNDNETPVITVSVDEFIPDESFLKKHLAAKPQGYACLSVSDNGAGIPEEDLEHIFEPFFTSKEIGKGTGLGLAMIDGTVASHGGLLEVTSQLGEGSCFLIYLPLLPDALSIETLEEEEGDISMGKDECVLLVEDEQILRETGRTVLESIGYQVSEACDGLQAITQVKKHQDHLQLIIMDVVMPRMGGVTAAKRIRKIKPSIPIIFVTGYDRSQVLGHSIDKISNCAVLIKPFSTKKLANLMKTQLRQNSGTSKTKKV